MVKLCGDNHLYTLSFILHLFLYNKKSPQNKNDHFYLHISKLLLSMRNYEVIQVTSYGSYFNVQLICSNSDMRLNLI
jgi:hypothetical protein